MAEKVKKEKSKARKIVEWILFGVFGVACVFVLAANVSAMVHKKDNYGQSIRFGVGTFVILTDSMEPEIKKNDFIITYKENVQKFSERLEKGENIDVTFMNIQINAAGFEPDTQAFKDEGHPTDATNVPMTHRLREVHMNEDVELGKGRYLFVASGINTKGFEAREGQYQIFTEKEYLGTVKSANSGLGKFMNFVSSAWGLIILLLVPGIYLIVISSIDIFKAVKEQEEAEANSSAVDSHINNNEDHLSNISQADRERLKNELLEQMIKEKKEGKK